MANSADRLTQMAVAISNGADPKPANAERQAVKDLKKEINDIKAKRGSVEIPNEWLEA